MATTVTAVQVNPLKGLHTGPNIVRSRIVNITTAASFTVSDVILLAQIPNKATVYGWRLHGGTGAAASTGTWKLGIGSAGNGGNVDPIGGASMTDDSLFAAMSLTTSGIYSSWNALAAYPNIPFKVSLSDDAAIQYVWITATASAGSLTGTTSMNFFVMYQLGE